MASPVGRGTQQRLDGLHDVVPDELHGQGLAATPRQPPRYRAWRAPLAGTRSSASTASTTQHMATSMGRGLQQRLDGPHDVEHGEFCGQGLAAAPRQLRCPPRRRRTWRAPWARTRSSGTTASTAVNKASTMGGGTQQHLDGLHDIEHGEHHGQERAAAPRRSPRRRTRQAPGAGAHSSASTAISTQRGPWRASWAGDHGALHAQGAQQHAERRWKVPPATCCGVGWVIRILPTRSIAYPLTKQTEPKYPTKNDARGMPS